MSQCFGTNNSCIGRNVSAFGSDIVNDIRNSICFGDKEIRTIFPNSFVCDLGREVVPFYNIYLSGVILNTSTGSNYITQEQANGIYQTLSGMGAYQLVSNMGDYLLRSGGNMVGSINMSGNAINTTQSTFTSGQLVSKNYVDTTVGNYLPLSGGTMTGALNLNNNQLTNVSKMTTSNGTFNVGYNNTDGYTSTNINVVCGNNNSITQNDQIIFGVGNSILSNETVVIGRRNQNISNPNGIVFGLNNSISAGSSNIIGSFNTIGNISNGYFTQCIGSNNISNGQYASCIGSDITNNTPNSLCLGNSAISTIFPNSLICDLGTSAKPYKDVYVSGEIKTAGLSKLDLQSINSFFIGIMFQHGSGLLTTMSNSLWTAAGSTSSAASTYATINNFTRQLCCGLWTFPTPADGQQCGYISTATTGIQVSTGFQFGLLSALGIADSAYNVNNCQNFWGLWNVSTAIPLAQTTQLSVQRNMICFGSNTTDANICIYTAGALNTVKQVDLGANFPSNRPSGAASTNFYRFSFYWDGTKIFYKAINTTSNITVQGSFTPLATDMPISSISLYPQCLRIMGSPNTTGQARLQVQRFGVFY